MKSAVVSGLLLAGLAAAAPLTEKRAARRAARASRRSNPAYVPGQFGVETLDITASSNVEYSENWAGAVLVGTGYTGVTAEFTVPTPSAPSDGSSREEYCASAWVGLDGDTCDTAILQTGVDFCVEDGEVAFDAWYEWYPAYAYDFSGISISAGDVVKLTIVADSTTSGTATIENVSTGVTVSEDFSGEEDALCEYNAEWIVEDFEEGDSLVPFADFGTVIFTNAEATHDGSTVTASGATTIDIEQDSVLTSVSVDDSTVTITYV